MLSPHLESLSRPVQTDKTSACQKIKARLVDTLELNNDLMLSVAQVDGERCLSPPLTARADQGRGRLVVELHVEFCAVKRSNNSPPQRHCLRL